MAFSFIASAGNQNSGSGTTLDCSTSLNVAAGDLLVGWMSQDSTGKTWSIAKDTGSPANTFTFDAGDAIANSCGGSLAYLLSASADATATFRGTWNAASTFRRIMVMQFRPDAGATVSKDTSHTGTGVSSSASSGAATTTGTDEVVCGASDLFNAGATSNEQINAVAAAGVLREDAAAIWYRILSATFAGGAATSTEGASDSWICGLIAFKSVGSGAGNIAWVKA